MKPNIVVIGSTKTDMIIKVPHLPTPGETILGGKFSVAQGGKGANQAVAAARAGKRDTRQILIKFLGVSAAIELVGLAFVWQFTDLAIWMLCCGDPRARRARAALRPDSAQL